MNKPVVVVGGSLEGKSPLETVAETAVNLEFGHDAEPLTLCNAMKMDEERLRNLVRGAAIITHSAGVMPVLQTIKGSSLGELPEELAIVASPEPMSIPSLVMAAARKTGSHLFGRKSRPRKNHLKVVASNAAELMAHPFASRRHIGAISRYSTISELDEFRSKPLLVDRTSIGLYCMEDDEFFSDSNLRGLAMADRLGYSSLLLAGRHDELLVNPEVILNKIVASGIYREKLLD